MLRKMFLFLGLALCVCMPALAGDLTSGLKAGSLELKSAGPLAFGPEGVLFVGDSEAAAVHAIATGDTSGNPEVVKINVDAIDEKIAAALGTNPAEITINDLVVNPASGNAYLSVHRGRGPEATAVLLRVDASGELSEVSLKNAKHASAELPGAPAEDAVRRRRNRETRLRPLSITDIAFVKGQIIVAGLSTEEFASTLRSIPYPFQPDGSGKGTGVRIYHGAHGGFETHSPVQTFTSMNINNEPHLLAAYTCTPLVRIPVSELVPGGKVEGTTVAELGNRNRPLDMVVYQQEGSHYVLLTNSARGTMKIKTDGIDRADGIEERIRGTEGQSYDTIAELDAVVQLDRLNDKHALVIFESEDGPRNLRTVALP